MDDQNIVAAPEEAVTESQAPEVDPEATEEAAA